MWRLSSLLFVFAMILPTMAYAADPVDFNRDIRPILSKNCFACHGPDENDREAGLRFDLREGAIEKLESGETAIVPGDPAASALYQRMTTKDESLLMPPKETGNQLSADEISTFRRWITEGAPYSKHWSFVKPTRPPLPQVSKPNWPRNGIDYFILRELDKRKFSPSEEADRYSLIRRVSLDLRGLPPTLAEVEQFIGDKSPNAYERLVDRFLADSAYGERWARMWLDLARYADSRGYGSDPLRPNIWRYRDWVIDAFNRNLPYDQFTIEQLAGDLLPNATLEQKIATAFHRNTMTNTEGGTDDEEFRVAAVRDRVDTTVQVWMGLTMGCAKCHNHKYDPISQEEYYRFYAYFNQTADRDLPNEDPVMNAPTPLIQQELTEIESKISDLKTTLNSATPVLSTAQKKWEDSLRTDSDWVVLQPEKLLAKNGSELQVIEDGSVLAGGTNPDNETYTVTATTTLAETTAIRLEALPDMSLPKKGSGRADDGNFALSKFSVTAEDANTAQSALFGRFVRIEVPGNGKLLSLAEVQVLSGGENVALSGQAQQSSTAYEGPAKLAIDGITDGDFFGAKSTTHTATEANPWWEVDLGKSLPLDRIVVWNRTDNNLQSRLANFRISIFNEPSATKTRQPVWQQDVKTAPNPTVSLEPSGKLAVELSRVSANFVQNGHFLNALVGAKTPANQAPTWSVASKQTESHSAWFIAAKPIQVAQKTRLTFELSHDEKKPRHSLGRFRLSVTNDPAALRRIDVPSNILALVDVPAERRTEAQQNQLATHYRSIAPLLNPVRKEIARLEKTKPAIPTVPVMQELAKESQRESYLMVKGNFLTKGDVVTPGLPAAFPEISSREVENRLLVADWLVNEDNPLTARVAVNRFWAKVFGIGIVSTEEDFGTQGELPTHPKLLDWLAVEFRQDDWNIKRLLRTMVTSATYRQSSRVSDDRLTADPNNRFLSRGPRFRLEAEMVRDQALALSGLLSDKIHGPSVYPPQPPGLWRAAFNGQRTWPTSEGEDSHRRGLYTFWRRTVPYPSMATFDAPSREICSIRRIRTNTPLQAFVTLNDPAYVEAAQALARRILAEGGETTESRAAYALQLCLVSPPQSQQIAHVVNLHDSAREHYANDAEAARQLATEPLGLLPDGMNAAEAAAWTVIANILLNLDAVLMKG